MGRPPGGGTWRRVLTCSPLTLPGARSLCAPHFEGTHRCVLTLVTAGSWCTQACGQEELPPGWVLALHAGQVDSCRLTCSDWNGVLENQVQELPSVQTGVPRTEGSEGQSRTSLVLSTT